MMTVGRAWRNNSPSWDRISMHPYAGRLRLPPEGFPQRNRAPPLGALRRALDKEEIL